MMARAIIGANWGDEGKGLAVDALAAKSMADGDRTTVVRTNGGAQAGHGVTLDDGRHHVFHHVGSGAFSGAATHLSRFFVCHPMVFFDELAELEGKGVRNHRVTADPWAVITTPWDMAINQALETARSGGRHGSCGLGFGETLERTETGPVLRMRDLWNFGIRERVTMIRDEWIPARMEALGLEVPEGPLADVLGGSDAVLDRFVEDLSRFAARVVMTSDRYLDDADAVIFEGAQGLRLDQDLGTFPHVTRSHTGLPNMVAVARSAGIEAIDAIYMTRAYATRHGAGPLPGDRGTEPLEGTEVVDRTNVANPWQEAIRYAPLDVPGLEAAIGADCSRVLGGGVAIDAGIGVTCLDQVAGKVELRIHADTGPVRLERDDVARTIATHAGREVKLVSTGPTREDVARIPARSVAPEPT